MRKQKSNVIQFSVRLNNSARRKGYDGGLYQYFQTNFDRTFKGMAEELEVSYQAISRAYDKYIQEMLRIGVK